MIKEALQFLGTTFTKSEQARLLSIPGDGRTAYVDQAGTVTKYDVTPAVRGHSVDTVDDLIAAARRWNSAPTVWVSPKAVVLVTDDGDRRDRVTLALKKSHAFTTLEGLEKSPKLDQTAFLRLLRIDLAGAVGRADLIAAVRQIKWRTAAAGDSNIQHGSESLGRTIEAAVTGAGAIPESVMVSCAVHSNHGERDQSFSVLCDLEIIPADQQFHFKPIADELSRVEDAALAGIHDRIAEALGADGVFFGSP